MIGGTVWTKVRIFFRLWWVQFKRPKPQEGGEEKPMNVYDWN